jgi:tRNA pseudouridine38-40 synthase
LVELFNSVNKIVLVVEYDGRNYYGFQWQTKLPTIQSELEGAIRKVTGESSRVIAASRTDTGVHARGQVVSFRTKSGLAPQVLVKALNYYLPRAIAVKGACKMNMDFNVRRDAVSREYDYNILNSSTRSPLFEGFAYFVPKKLNTRIMNKACKFLEGEHDFASFATALGKLKSTMRTVYEARVTKKEDLVTYHVKASSFLPHQVRNTVGLLIRVGLGKVGLDEFRRIMEAKVLGLAGPTAPAYGLCLTRVNYPGNLELTI